MEQLIGTNFHLLKNLKKLYQKIYDHFEQGEMIYQELCGGNFLKNCPNLILTLDLSSLKFLTQKIRDLLQKGKLKEKQSISSI